MAKLLVVGAGFAGAVYAYEAAEAGHAVTVIDKRPHIAGNCFDYVHDSGVRVHRYGPHLFHTSNQRVVAWLSQFTDWTPYEHRVAARLPSGDYAPMPINLDTVNAVFGAQLDTPEEIAAFLAALAQPRDPIVSAEDFLVSKIGAELTDLFYRPYTKKMWSMDLSDVDADVVRRLKIRDTTDDRYFSDEAFQAMPKDGYTPIFERILSHERISVSTSTAFTPEMLEQYDFCFNSMPIDEFYDFDLGELPYRSIRFHMSEHAADDAAAHTTINYTDDGPYTRETWWHNIPGHHVKNTDTVLRTIEEPCDYRDNDYERFYPVKSSDGRYDALYERYAQRAADQDNQKFIGRCGTYQYLDMHQVINQSLIGVAKWLESARI